jgi:hypothetical protein
VISLESGPDNARGRDAYVRKHDSTGAMLCSQLLGTDVDDQANAIAVDGLGNEFISVKTAGDLGGEGLGKKETAATRSCSCSPTPISPAISTSMAVRMPPTIRSGAMD